MPTFLLLKVEVFEVVKVSVPTKPESVNEVVALLVASYTLFEAEAVAVRFLTIILAPFPSGLVVYWTINNILTIAQQWVIMRNTRVKTV